MPDIVYRFDPDHRETRKLPADAAQARRWLERGNREFANLLDEPRVIPVHPAALGIADGDAAPQQPFAAVLGCSDARVPTELVFHRASNDLFVVRVAGNVAGSECLGSLEYAVTNLHETLRLIVVLGHTGCAAVTAAVDAFLEPSGYVSASQPLRSIVDKILPSVRTAAEVLGERASDHALLLDRSVTLHAAATAMTLKRELLGIEVLYGVFDLVRRTVELRDPPSDADRYAALARDLAQPRSS